jgi:hypothetical protein
MYISMLEAPYFLTLKKQFLTHLLAHTQYLKNYFYKNQIDGYWNKGFIVWQLSIAGKCGGKNWGKSIGAS